MTVALRGALTRSLGLIVTRRPSAGSTPSMRRCWGLRRSCRAASSPACPPTSSRLRSSCLLSPSRSVAAQPSPLRRRRGPQPRLSTRAACAGAVTVRLASCPALPCPPPLGRRRSERWRSSLAPQSLDSTSAGGVAGMGAWESVWKLGVPLAAANTIAPPNVLGMFRRLILPRYSI